MQVELLAGEHAVDIDGVRQVYHVAGSGPVCLVHSGGPGVHWNYLRMPLLEERFTMLYLEPVGSGASGLLPDGDYSVERYAHFSERLLTHLGLDRVHFIGHSHGGFVGLQFALDHPDRLHSLVAYDTAPLVGPELSAEAGRKVDEFVARRSGRPEAEQVLTAWREGSGDDRESNLNWLQRMLPIYLENYAGHEADYASWLAGLDMTVDPGRKPDTWDIRDRLASIETRTLVVVGKEDFICGTKWAEELALGMPCAESVILPATGHMAHIELPADFAGLVADFVTSDTPR